jgi:predicted GTPase
MHDINRRKILIMGAAGRDFHNFNLLFRNNPSVEVKAFTATQIPNISDRVYPSELSGNLYPEGIPIFDEKDLGSLISEMAIDEVYFSYSDVSHRYVMNRASLVTSLGARFVLVSADETMLRSKRPVIAVCAVRTGCGKSQTTRKAAEIFREKGMKVVVIRHPMPYGDLKKQKMQRFASLNDLEIHDCTIEEWEEYEHHIELGCIVYAGVDYGVILSEAEKEADIILWDGGNNDTPFIKPDLHITVTDPHRAGHERQYFPGETNLLMANIIIINKVDSARAEDLNLIRNNIKEMNPRATVIESESEITLSQNIDIADKKVLIIEDGPTITHGEMTFGAGFLAAQRLRAKEIVDPKPFAKGSIVDIYSKYRHIGRVLPAMGYTDSQIDELQETIKAVSCDLVIIGTPIDLGKILKIDKPYVRVKYSLKEITKPDLADILQRFLPKH